MLSFSFGVSQGSSFEDIVVVKKLDKSSPKIIEKCVKGDVIPSIVMEICRSTGDKNRFYMVEMHNVIISSFFSNIDPGDDVPVETMTLHFDWIKITYTEIDDTGAVKGNVEFTWNLITRTS